MGGNTDRLQTTLGQTAYGVLEILVASPTPMSGRMVASALAVSPMTATAALRKLRDAGFVFSSREGRADRWHLNTDDAVLRSWLEETRSGPNSEEATKGMSPYATGAGGVTFERKVGVQYLVHLLVGDGAVELGEGRVVVRVAYQQAPEHAVDDLVIHAARGDEAEPSLVLAVGVRRSPNLVQSDQSTGKLIRGFVQELVNVPDEGPERRFALVVAGAQEHAKQLALLGDLASKQADAPSYFRLARSPRKFPAAVRERLAQIEALVRLALSDLGLSDPDRYVVEQRTWELLSRLRVRMPRLETPDEADWAAVTNALVPVARGADLYGATRLRDRLVALVDEYAPKAATVDLSLLRRDAHGVLDASVRRHRQGWEALAHLHERAIASVRDEIASGDGSRSVHLDRGDAAADFFNLARSTNGAVVAHGESGVGKSALVLRTVTDAAANAPDTIQALCINLRQLPPTTLALQSFLGSPLAVLLAELSAPQRMLVIDGADAVSEGMLEPLCYLADAGRQAGVKVVAIAANDAKQLVRDTLAQRSEGAVAEFLVPPLADAQIDCVVATFGELSALAGNARSRELLRRPVVVDLLVRGGLSGMPLSDADAMRQVWTGLVRRQGQPDRGTPDAREFALLRLADLALLGGDPLDVVGAIDPAALDGVQRDGLLRASVDDPFRIGPEFAHDEVRRYAVARLLLAARRPAATLAEAGVPRWALGAARLACQALLAEPDRPADPLPGRFSRLRRAFDQLVEAGHGERWADVPGEALLTLGNPETVLRDAWPELSADGGAGVRWLCRLVDQRLRDENGFVRIVAVEPLIGLLLDDDAPWSAGKHVEDVLREWLRALAITDTRARHPLRTKLHDRLVAACAAADRRLEEERAAAATARAARSPEEIEEERRLMESRQALFTAVGHPRSRHRERPDVPREITDETMVEFLALLGPDLREDGEAVLRRVATDAPSWLRPAVEELFTGRALALYRRGFLAELTEAYYVDDEEDGSGLHEDGIRHHHARGLRRGPLAAWYRGPFMMLFQTDLRNGVAVLNRMLNHAALARARTLSGLHHHGARAHDGDLAAYRTELQVTGTPRVYVGDGHVWTWYRGTGVGPYPCMSALQALERVCDQLVEAGVPLATLVATLLDGCENLAMVALVVGLLARHIERADGLLDPYLAEPAIWHLEVVRVVQENSGLAARSDGLVAPERREWSLREAAMFLVLRADDSRADELRTIGEQLVTKVRRLAREELGDVDEATIERSIATERAWASGLDRSTYEAQETEGGLLIQSTLPPEVAQALESRNIEVRRAQESTRLIVRYYIQPKQGTVERISADDLTADLAIAKDLLENPPALSAGPAWDTPAAVTAAALEANLIDGLELSDDALRFAVDTVLRIGAGEVPPPQFESEESYFEQGADRSAARVLPLLLSPSAQRLRVLVDGGDGSQTYERTRMAARNLTRSVANEVRVHLARGLDRLWTAPCATGGTCHHETALQLAVETMRDCALGGWDPERERRQRVELNDPVTESLGQTADNAIDPSRLDAAMRALAPATTAGICVSPNARDLLVVLLAAHRRSLLAYDRDMDHRGTHALNAARALLTVAANHDDEMLFEHLNAYADNATLLSTFLHALSATAEESPRRAATARRIWPPVVARVLGLEESGHAPFRDRYSGDQALAALMPNAAGEVAYLYREVETAPIVWWEPLAWQSTVEEWLTFALGNPMCVDQLISFIGPLPMDDQARVGLPWVAELVLADPARVANRTFLLSSWLIEVRQAASDADLLSVWQGVVDALVVAGATRLATYSE